jgi:Uncharacterized protein conserved in bacteria
MRKLCIALALSLSVLGCALCASAAAPKVAKNVPTRITADGMTYEADKRVVSFSKSVHVFRPDFELWSDKLVVHLKPVDKKEGEEESASPTEGMAAGDIERIVATGNVRMKRDKNSSTSELATYTMDTEVLVLEGNPRLSDGENVISGEVVRYYMRENRSEVVRGKKPVEAIFTTTEKPRGN